MISVRPTDAALQEAGGFLRAVSSARQTYSLYPAGHPNRQEGVREILECARRLREQIDGDPIVFCVRHAFYLGPALLPRESLSLYQLIEAFETTSVEAVEILPGLSAAGVDTLVRILLAEVDPRTRCEGLAVNRVRPSLPESDRDRGLAEVRRSYALGLELLRQTAVRVGAEKPVDQDAASRLVEKMANHVVQDPAQALLLTSVKSHDEYTYYHMLNVCLLSLALGYAVGLRPDQIVALGVGALLHDVGKVNVPPDILSHAGALTEEQWRLVQRHPVDGAALILQTTGVRFDPTASIVLEHHAAFDLSGYPSLSGRPHPSVPARMVAVADAYDAITTNRPYRRAEERRQALNVLQAGAGRGFDPSVVRGFVRLLGIFPVGSLVRLHGGEIGVVVKNHDTLLSRPSVRLVLDASGTPCPPEERDLTERGPDGEYRWAVERSVDPEEVQLDMMSLLLSEETREAEPSAEEPAPGLVHEPSFGEAPPAGYVDTHNR